MKWDHWRIRSVVPRVCAGAWRASSIVAMDAPAAPSPAVLTKSRRVTVWSCVRLARVIRHLL